MNIQEMIKLRNWVVIGDVNNKSKYAFRILNLFASKGYNVYGVHPNGGDGIYQSLKDVPIKIEAIDLCINPYEGIKLIKEAHELGIVNVLIQPGAGSKEIIEFCEANGMNAIKDCALIQLNRYISK